MLDLSGSGIAAVVGVLLSLALAYIPGFRARWENFAWKREALGLVGLLTAGALVGLHTAGALDLGLGAFGWATVWRALEAWLAFAGAGQLTYTAQARAQVHARMWQEAPHA